MADHPSTDDLADAAEGLLDPDCAERVAAHLSGCASCRATAVALTRVGDVLAAEPAPSMPPAVAERLAGVVAAESDRRAAVPARAVPRPRPHDHRSLGPFTVPAGVAPRWRRWVPALAATLLASAVGLGGYVLSATAGLNEPPVLGVAITSADLAGQASALEQSRDLDAHRFSRAWLCARAVTAGRITGLVRVPVDGTPALLAYTRSDGADHVTVVTGCRGPAPAAVASADLPG